MIPRGAGTCWCILLSGPAVEVTAHKDEFDQFVRSVRFDGDRPTWTEPQGWKFERGTGQRLATFHLGDPDSPLEGTITKQVGPKAADVLENVNRWRNQLGLGLAAEAELHDYATESKIDDQVVTMIDLTGLGGMRGAAAKRQAKEPPIDYDVPQEWKQVANPKDSVGGVKRVASFEVGKDDKLVEINIQLLSGDGGDDLQNVLRWRGQLKLAPAKDEELKKHIRPEFTVAGKEALYAVIDGDGPNAQTIVGVLVRRGGVAWTIKMKGPKRAVEEQKAAFDKFLGTIRFGED